VLAKELTQRLHVPDALLASRAVREQAFGDHVEHEHGHADHADRDDLHDDRHVVPEFH
jgi:hypothetical protein